MVNNGKTLDKVTDLKEEFKSLMKDVNLTSEQLESIANAYICLNKVKFMLTNGEISPK